MKFKVIDGKILKYLDWEEISLDNKAKITKVEAH